MKVFSIDLEVSKFKAAQSKVYHYLYAESGFELGFGKAGNYSGHSHLFLFDLIFSLNPIVTSDANGKSFYGNLILVPPRTYLGDVVADNFMFLKFCPSKSKITLPDKTNDVLIESEINAYSSEVIKYISWYRSHLSAQSFITIFLEAKMLTINIGESKFKIVK